MSDSIVMIRSSSPRELQRAAEAGVERAARALVLDLLEHLERQAAALRRAATSTVRSDEPSSTRMIVPPSRHSSGRAAEVPHQVRDVGLLIEGRNHDDGHQYAPFRPSTVGIVRSRILMSHHRDQLVT